MYGDVAATMLARTRTRWQDGLDVSFKTSDEAQAFWLQKRAFFLGYGYALHILQSHSSSLRTQPEGQSCDETLQVRSAQGEDSEGISNRVYATRVSDNLQVCLKRVATLSLERLLLDILHERADKFDVGNHCIPLLEVIRDNEQQRVSYLVMPALQPLDPSAFKTVNDVVEFTSQMILWLRFMSRKAVAHRDCSMHNIVVDSFRRESAKRKDSSRSHRWYQSVKWAILPTKPTNGYLHGARYYFVGFGSAVDCGGADKQCATGNYSRDQEPSELSRPFRMYDPLLLDVSLVGNMLRRELIDKYSNVNFLEELVSYMTQYDPERREDANFILGIWLAALPHISSRTRRQRLRNRSEPRIEYKKHLR